MSSKSENTLLSLVWQILRFGVVGVLSTLLDYGGFLVLNNLFGIHYLVASTTSYALAIVFNYWLSMKYVFTSSNDRSKKAEFSIYALLTLVGLGLNQLFLYLCVSWLGTSENLGKLVATILVMLYNFISRKIWIEAPATTASK